MLIFQAAIFGFSPTNFSSKQPPVKLIEYLWFCANKQSLNTKTYHVLPKTPSGTLLFLLLLVSDYSLAVCRKASQSCDGCGSGCTGNNWHGDSYKYLHAKKIVVQ